MSDTEQTSSTTKQIEHLLWPPKHMLPMSVPDNERIDLLAYLDAEVYNARGSYPLKLNYGVTVLRDRVVLEQERFSSPSRDHQTALASQFQASFAEQGFAVVVKEWANTTQKRSILRVRLKCRFAGCKFHFQINWDQNMGYWFISRRRCGIFQHSCRIHDKCKPTDAIVHHPHKRAMADSPPPSLGPASKRARTENNQERSHDSVVVDQPYLVTPHINGNHGVPFRTVSCEHSPAAADRLSKPAPKAPNEKAAIDFAESLLELSKGNKGGSQHEDESVSHDQHFQQRREQNALEQKEQSNVPQAHIPQAHSTMLLPPNARTREIVLGEIPHGTQAFAQMANTMGPSLFAHLTHGRGEVNLTMTFDGEAFILRTCVPTGPPSMPHPPQPPQHQPIDGKTGRMGPLNYPYIAQRRYPPPSRNDPAVVML